MAKSNNVRKKVHKQKLGKNDLRRRKLVSDLDEFIENFSNIQNELSKANAVARNFVIGLCSSVFRDMPYFELIFGNSKEDKVIEEAAKIDELKYQLFAYNVTRNEHILNFNNQVNEIANPLVDLRNLLNNHKHWGEFRKANGKEAVATELDGIEMGLSAALINAQQIFQPTFGFAEVLMTLKEKLETILPEGYIEWMEAEYRQYCNRLRNGEEGLVRLTDIENDFDKLLVEEWNSNPELYQKRLEKEIAEREELEKLEAQREAENEAHDISEAEIVEEQNNGEESN